MDDEIIASTKNVVLRTRARRAEEDRDDKLEQIEQKLDLLLSKMNNN